MHSSTHKSSLYTCFLLLILIFIPSAEALALVVKINHPALRGKIARAYAPEIHQDQAESFGLASIAYALRRSKLRAVVHKCPALPKGTPTVALAPGVLLAVPPPKGHISWQDKTKRCKRHFGLFATKKHKHHRRKYLPAPNRVFVQFDNHRPETLLKGPHRRAITPVISFHTYEIQRTTCTRRNLFFSCQSYKTRRFYIVQYFVTLMFNQACNEHEGEHEGMVMLVDANGFDWAQNSLDRYKAIQKIGLFGHYHTKIYTPNKLTFADLTHPIIYMGKGGHALYPKSGSTALLNTFPVELRRVMKRTCTKRGRLARLTEHHRGGGLVYKSWQPAEGKLVSKLPATLYLPPLPETLRRRLATQPALHAKCILARQRPGVRLCDVQPSKHNDRCCLKGARKGYAPWVQFTGRWGSQEAFASSLSGAAAAQAGRFLRRWPLARSMGNSGPFGPQWIHASTWRWHNPTARPAATSALWR